MKKQTGIWIDSSKAIIVTLLDGKEHIIKIESNIENLMDLGKEGNKGTFMGTHHINNERKFEERKKHQVDSFLKNVIEEIKQDDELYVFGPGEVKLKLKTAIENTNHLSSRLKSLETADSMTQNQLVAKVKDFYED